MIEDPFLNFFLLLAYPKTSVGVLAAKLPSDLDEERLKWMIERHRVWNLVATNVKKLDSSHFSPDFLAWLDKAEARCKQKTLLQFRIQSELANLLDVAGVHYRFFKGIDLSLRLYNDLNCRFSRDIDLLVAEKDAIEAERVIIKYGYSPLSGAFTDNDPGGIIHGQFNKDKSYQAVGLPLIELHTRISNENTRFSKAVTAYLLIGEHNLSVIEYLYLCVHALKSNCHRIKWLIDLACYYEKLNESTSQWHEEKWQRAKEFGITRQVIACEYLFSQCFGLAVTERRFMGMNGYCDWIQAGWGYVFTSKSSLKKFMLPVVTHSQFDHHKKAIYYLLFCPNSSDRKFINRYAKDDGRYICLLLPFRKLSRFAQKIFFK